MAIRLTPRIGTRIGPFYVSLNARSAQRTPRNNTPRRQRTPRTPVMLPTMDPARFPTTPTAIPPRAIRRQQARRIAAENPLAMHTADPYTAQLRQTHRTVQHTAPAPAPAPAPVGYGPALYGRPANRGVGHYLITALIILVVGVLGLVALCLAAAGLGIVPTTNPAPAPTVTVVRTVAPTSHAAPAAHTTHSKRR